MELQERAVSAITVSRPSVLKARPKKYRKKFCRCTLVSIWRLSAHSLNVLARLGTRIAAAVHRTAACAMGMLLSSLRKATKSDQLLTTIL